MLRSIRCSIPSNALWDLLQRHGNAKKFYISPKDLFNAQSCPLLLSSRRFSELSNNKNVHQKIVSLLIKIIKPFIPPKPKGIENLNRDFPGAALAVQMSVDYVHQKYEIQDAISDPKAFLNGPIEVPAIFHDSTRSPRLIKDILDQFDKKGFTIIYDGRNFIINLPSSINSPAIKQKQEELTAITHKIHESVHHTIKKTFNSYYIGKSFKFEIPFEYHGCLAIDWIIETLNKSGYEATKGVENGLHFLVCKGPLKETIQSKLPSLDEILKKTPTTTKKSTLN